jgi:hypothetical protein
VEFTMTNRDVAPWAEFIDLFLTAANGVFPGPVLEAVLARIEAQP